MKSIARRLSLAILLAMAAPALAQGNTGGPPELLPDEITWPPSESIPDVAGVKLGSLSVALEETRLADVAAAVDGTVRHLGDAASSLHWICVDTDAPPHNTRIWFVSTEIAGGAVNEIILEKHNPNGSANTLCSGIRADHLPFELPGLPFIGQQEAEARAQLPAPGYERKGTLGFLLSRDLPEDCNLSQSLGLRIAGGRVDAISLTRITSC